MYEVGVQDSIVPTRNTALIRCHVPSSVSSYVQVSAWLTDDGLTILAHDDPGKHIVWIIAINNPFCPCKKSKI